MTALDRALAWFLEPPAHDGADDAPGDRGEPGAAGQTTWLRPAADPDPLDAISSAAPGSLAAFDHRAAASPGGPVPSALAGVASPEIARREIRCAAVLGRPGHAEPVAAAVALALGAAAPARAATVAVIGRDAGPERDGPHPSGGTRAARRLAARLDAHGLAVRPRGRLVWADVAGEGREAAARRVALVGTPAVLAVTAPRAPDIEALLAEQDLLLLVMADPASPLARVAALAPAGAPIAVTRPLPRGPARSLALAGIAAPRSIRRLAAGTTAAAEPA